MMKTALRILVTASFTLAAFGAVAQSTEASHSNAANANRAKAVEDFASKEKYLQDLSRSSASGSGATKPPSEASKFTPNGKEMAETMRSNQTFKGSKPVDKNAKATAPMKSISKMTPEERAQLRNEVVKEAKP